MNTSNNHPAIVKVLGIEQFLEGFIPIMALYAIMFERTGGLNFEQIGALFSIWSITYLLFELPSGVLADYWSRKKLIALGGVARAVGFLIWILYPSFTGYAIGFACWGVQIAFSSGSVSALLENELKATKMDKSFTKYYGWITSSFWTGILIGHILSALLTLNNAELLIQLSIASSLLYAVVMLASHESPYDKRGSYLGTLKAGVQDVRRSKELQILGFILFSVYMIIGVLEELLPRLYAQFGLNDSGVSMALSVALLLTIFVVAKLEKTVRFSIAKQLGMMIAGLVILLLGLYTQGLSGVALVMLFSLIFQLFRPLFQNHVVKATKSAEKATVTSIPGLAGGVVGAVAYVVIGILSRGFGEVGSIALYTAFWLAVLCVTVLHITARTRDNNNTTDPD